MQRTRYGFFVDFDTTKAKKYSDEKRREIAQLKRDGLSVRQIADKLNIPKGSIHYILREQGAINLGLEQVDLTKYIDRATALANYGIRSRQFDYYIYAYKDKVLRANGKVYIEKQFLFSKTIDRDITPYKLTEEEVKDIQDMTLDTRYSHRTIAKIFKIDPKVVNDLSLRSKDERSNYPKSYTQPTKN